MALVDLKRARQAVMAVTAHGQFNRFDWHDLFDDGAVGRGDPRGALGPAGQIGRAQGQRLTEFERMIMCLAMRFWEHVNAPRNRWAAQPVRNLPPLSSSLIRDTFPRLSACRCPEKRLCLDPPGHRKRPR